MTIQQLASPGGKASIAATLVNAPGRSGNAHGSDFASTLRDSIDRTTDRDRASDDDMQAARVKKRSTGNDRRDDDSQPENAAQNTAEGARAPTGSGDAAKAGPAEGVDAPADAPAEGSNGSGRDAETQGRAFQVDAVDPAQGKPAPSSATPMLFARDQSGQASDAIGEHGRTGVLARLATDGKAVPVGGMDLPPGPQLTIDATMGSDGTANIKMHGMPDTLDTGMLNDIPLLKTGTEQTAQNPLLNLQGSLQSALAPARDGRPLPAEASATAGHLQLYASADTGSEAWLDDFGTKIQWLQNMKVSRADMTLHPAELGSIEIRVVTEDNNTRVTIVTQTGAARDAIEGTLPRLREMLAGQGMSLEQGSVSQQTAEERRQQHTAQRNNGLVDGDDVLTDVSARQQTRLLAAGQIDHYV